MTNQHRLPRCIWQTDRQTNKQFNNSQHCTIRNHSRGWQGSWGWQVVTTVYTDVTLAVLSCNFVSQVYRVWKSQVWHGQSCTTSSLNTEILFMRQSCSVRHAQLHTATLSRDKVAWQNRVIKLAPYETDGRLLFTANFKVPWHKNYDKNSKSAPKSFR